MAISTMLVQVVSHATDRGPAPSILRVTVEAPRNWAEHTLTRRSWQSLAIMDWLVYVIIAAITSPLHRQSLRVV